MFGKLPIIRVVDMFWTFVRVRIKTYVTGKDGNNDGD